LAGVENPAFGGWGVFSDGAYEAATFAGVLDKEHLNAVREELKEVVPSL